MTHKHSATLWQLHTALQKEDGDVMPCTTVCVLHVVSWNVNCVFSLHQLEIRVLFNGGVITIATPRGARSITVISSTLINEPLSMLMVALLTPLSTLNSGIPPNWHADA